MPRPRRCARSRASSARASGAKSAECACARADLPAWPWVTSSLPSDREVRSANRGRCPGACVGARAASVRLPGRSSEEEQEEQQEKECQTSREIDALGEVDARERQGGLVHG